MASEITRTLKRLEQKLEILIEAVGGSPVQFVNNEEAKSAEYDGLNTTFTTDNQIAPGTLSIQHIGTLLNPNVQFTYGNVDGVGTIEFTVAPDPDGGANELLFNYKILI